jgi:DNA polymerase III subunit delta'
MRCATRRSATWVPCDARQALRRSLVAEGFAVNLLPWLEPAAARLAAAHAAGRLPPALLLHAPRGIGAEALVRYFAQLRFCTEASPPCGRCSHCRRVEAGEHPDFNVVVPDPELKLGQISIAQVRELSEKLSLSSYEGRGTVVVLDPADALNRNAANALLKTLEEPRADAHLVLLSSAPSLLPATIRSRCQKLPVPAPERAVALAWLDAQLPAQRANWPAVLELLGVAPLEAIEADVPRLLAIRDEVRRLLADSRQGRVDVIRAAEAWARDDLPLRLRGIENCLTVDLLALRAGAGSAGAVPDINMASALRLLTELRELQHQLAGAALNKPLALERQFWRLNGAGAGQSR